MAASKTQNMTRVDNKLPGIFREADEQKLDAKSLATTIGDDIKIYVEPFASTAAAKAKAGQRRVISTSFFIFPERSKSFTEYKIRVEMFMNGLEKGLQGIGAYEGWEYVLYLDYSVYKTYDDPHIKKITDDAKARIRDMASRYDYLRRVGVRSTTKHESTSTFLPSVWRFIPMMDPSVEVFTSIDLDNPPSPLIMHLGNVWMKSAAGSTSNSLFVTMDHYFPMQCTLYMARHLNMDETDSPKNSSVRCPIAQFWFWRNTPQQQQQGRVQFESMCSVMRDEDLKRFFEVPSDWIFNEFRNAAVHSAGFRALLARAGATVTVKDLEGVTRNALGSLVENKEWAAIVLAKPVLMQILTMAIFGRIIGPAGKSNPYQKMVANFAILDKFQGMSDIVTKVGYGIDEYVMSVIMNTPATATVYSVNAAEAGMKQGPPGQLGKAIVLRGTPPVSVSLLRESVLSDCRTFAADPYPNHQSFAVEYIVRTAIFHMFLRPDARSSEESKRWFAQLMGHYEARVKFINERHNAVQFLLEKENQYIRSSMFTLMQMDVPKFAGWCRQRQITYSNNRLTYETKSVEQMNELKEVVVRKIFLDWFVLLLGTCVPTDRIQDFNRIPW